MKKKSIFVILFVLSLLFFEINYINAHCLNPSHGCNGNIVTYGANAVIYLYPGSKYYVSKYVRQNGDHRNVYCVNRGKSEPVLYQCNTSYNSFLSNSIRAAIGYIMKNYDSDYPKAQYLIHRVLETYIPNDKPTGEPTPLYVDEYTAAIEQKNNYEKGVGGTYYLANIYSCGGNIQEVTDSYTTEVIPSYLDVNVLVDGSSTDTPQNYVTFNMTINNTTVRTGISDYWTKHDPGTQYSLTNLEIINDAYAFDGIYEDSNTSSVSYERYKSGVMGNAARTIWIKVKSKGSLKIKKVNQNGYSIINKNVTFDVYPSSNCSGTPREFSFNTGGNGEGSITLNAGYYSIKETSAPEGYGLSDECIYVGYLDNGSEISTTVTNKTQCEFDFEKDSSISNRLELYKKYSFRNLLNFDESNASLACSSYTPNYNSEMGCLESDQVKNIIEKENPTKTHSFNSQDISGFNETISINGAIGYCLTDFEFKKDDNVDYISTNIVKAGRMIFNIGKNQTLARGRLTKICYIYKDDCGNDCNVLNRVNLDDYISEIVLDDRKLLNSTNEKSMDISQEGSFYKVQDSLDVIYKSKPVYAEAITGKIEGCLDEEGNPKDSCRIIGYGVASKFNDAKKLYPTEPTPLIRNFNFTITPALDSIFSLGTATCEYQVEPEIIEYNNTDNGDLDLEFRIVDTKNPFNRNTKSNWSDGLNNNKNNNTVTQYITNNDVNNSYNRTGEGSLYTNQTDGTKRIILTPDLVKKIREYNQANPYDDYTVYTERVDGKEKTSTSFFDYIGITKTE